MDNISITIDESMATAWAGAQEGAIDIKIHLQTLINTNSFNISSCVSYFFEQDTAIEKR